MPLRLLQGPAALLRPATARLCCRLLERRAAPGVAPLLLLRSPPSLPSILLLISLCCHLWQVFIETVDSFQGKQLDVVILSCVRASVGGSLGAVVVLGAASWQGCCCWLVGLLAAAGRSCRSRSEGRDCLRCCCCCCRCLSFA